MPQSFLARVAGKTVRVFATVVSAGAADAGKILGLGPNGRLDESVLPIGIGADTKQAVADGALGAGDFVNFFNVGGVFSCRMADNSNNRPAHGFVTEAVAGAAMATVYPLDGTNSELAGLTVGAEYWLGTAGDVTATPLDGTDPATAGRICQKLGIASSETELKTDDYGYVVL